MADGCPLPNCDTAKAECQRTHTMVRNLYSHCLQSEEGQVDANKLYRFKQNNVYNVLNNLKKVGS